MQEQECVILLHLKLMVITHFEIAGYIAETYLLMARSAFSLSLCFLLFESSDIKLIKSYSVVRWTVYLYKLLLECWHFLWNLLMCLPVFSGKLYNTNEKLLIPHLAYAYQYKSSYSLLHWKCYNKIACGGMPSFRFFLAARWMYWIIEQMVCGWIYWHANWCFFFNSGLRAIFYSW